MRSIAVLAAVCGLALLTGLTVYYGLGAVAAAVVSSGWATVLVVAVRAAALAGAGILVGSGPGAPTRTFGFRTAAIRPRGHQLVLSSGGDRWRCSRGKLLARFGLIGNLAFASVLIDIFIQLVCLFCFVLAGLGIVLSVAGQQPISTTAPQSACWPSRYRPRRDFFSL